jgi:DNA-binding NarL/FixJ family response regulator
VRVLVVDDSPAVRKRLLELLSDSKGVEQVWQAADAAEALQLVRSNPIELALLDISLGAQTGLELLRTLRAEYSHIKVLVLTNSSTDAHRSECLRRGAHFFFDKSHDFERAMAVVTSVAGACRGGV